MSILKNIDLVASIDGVEAVAVTTGGRAVTFRGDPRWNDFLRQGLSQLVAASSKGSLCVNVASHVVMSQRVGEEWVAVVLPDGHPSTRTFFTQVTALAR